MKIIRLIKASGRVIRLLKSDYPDFPFEWKIPRAKGRDGLMSPTSFATRGNALADARFVANQLQRPVRCVRFHDKHHYRAST